MIVVCLLSKKGGEKMVEKITKVMVTLIFAVAGFFLARIVTPPLVEYLGWEIIKEGVIGFTILDLTLGLVGAAIFGIMGWMMTPFLLDRTLRISERIADMLSNLPTFDIVVVAAGVIIGLIVATLFGSAFSRLPVIGPYIPLLLSIVAAIVGAKVALSKRTDIEVFFDRTGFFRNTKEKSKKAAPKTVSCNYKILDTSVLIDGRVADIITTGFLEGPIVIAQFVLEELQKIADSADTLKRNRGRRGLDVVKEIQNNNVAQVIIAEKDYDDITEVDAKLLRLAKDMGGFVATNDYNLSKVADIQGVRILNINDLANALKQAVLPGEELNVFLAKEGKEPGQAIGYLDDGTMIVVERGKRSVNFTVPVIVTSVLQTSAGRMIFAKIK